MLLRLKPKMIIRVGYAFLLVASVANYAGRHWLPRSGRVTEGAIDGITGLLYGITIGLLLFGVCLLGRQRFKDDAGARV